jgi:hypothetical protein
MGPIHDELLADVARLDLTPHEAVDIILGFPGLAEGLLPGRSYLGPDGRIRLDLLDAGGASARRIEFDSDGHLARVELGAAREGGQVVEFAEYELIHDTPFAHRVAIESRTSRATLVLSGVELNPELPPSTFAVDTSSERDGE